MSIRTATRAAAIATALITMSFGMTACGIASGASTDGGVYVAQDSGRDVLVIDGDAVSTASVNTDHGDDCAHYTAMLEHAEKNELTKDHEQSDGQPNYDGVNVGTMDENGTSVLWSQGSDQGEVATVQTDAPLEGMVTLDGQVYVPVDGDAGKALVDEQRTEHCG